LSYASTAVIDSLKDLPAVCVPGVGRVNEFTGAGLTVKLDEVAGLAPDELTVNGVDWASYSVMLAVPLPATKVTDDG
jgi:hypothetical protein